jgi:hypothetical protein
MANARAGGCAPSILSALPLSRLHVSGLFRYHCAGEHLKLRTVLHATESEAALASRLYEDARSTLPSSIRQGLDDLLSWMRSSLYIDRDYAPKVAWNIENENHYVGDLQPFDHSEYAIFLERSSAAAALPEDERHDTYEAACRTSAGKGRPADRSRMPNDIYRYVMTGAVRSWGMRIGMPAAWLVIVDTQPFTAFETLLQHLDAHPHLYAECRLARDDSRPWASFNDPDNPLSDDVRTDATLMAGHLGLRVRGRGRAVLIELAYAKIAMHGSRHPTVADAAWEHRFRSAPPRSPWGLTAADGRYVPQPEVVHENASLAILRRRPRFLGRVRAEAD